MTPRFQGLLGLALGTWAATAPAAQPSAKGSGKTDCRWSDHWRAPTTPSGSKAVPPKKVRDVPIQWPQDGEFGVSVRRRVKGIPVVEALVDENGRVADTRLVRRTEWRPPWPAFDQAVLEAVRQWEFEPATIAGKPVQACLTLAVPVDWR